MPSAAAGPVVTLPAEQREALYEHLLDHLSGIGDLARAIDRRDFETAKRIGREFADELRLILDDLGWGDGEREDVELSMSPDDLRRTFRRIREQAKEQRDGSGPGEGQIARRAELVIETCDKVLAALGSQPSRMKISSATPRMPRR